MAACEGFVAASISHATDLKDKSARFRKQPLQKREGIRTAPQGRQFPADEERIRLAFPRRGAALGKLSWDWKAAKDRTRSERVASSQDPVRQTSWTSCISFPRPRRAPQ